MKFLLNVSKECMKAQAVYDEITQYYKKHVTSANYLDLQHVEAVNHGRRRMKVELTDQEIIKLVDQSFTKYTDERQSSGYQTWLRRAVGQSTRFQVAILGSTVLSSVVGVCVKTSMFRFGGVIVGGMVVFLLSKLWSSGAASPVTINFSETTSKQLKREIELYFEKPDFVGMFVKDF
ncbi:uncharacterized protein LOC143446415 [Clavelina lepadiformis]|uniref:uncharacterized protein LOC143446415 n=1 Tax=Clavelina lepadiformis TaxID=159417 RepID=UPI004042F83E